MRKVLSGYAGYYNRRHRRRGYVFQNRYKAILCQEDVYLLELVRYIHLNPVRAEIVKTMGELDRYLWTGHAAIIGKREIRWQERGEVLGIFGRRKEEARRRYRAYVRDGLDMGEQEQLMGGGLRRSAGGWAGVMALKRDKTYWSSDERILGDGEFVERALKEAEVAEHRREKLKRKGWDLKKVADRICDMFNIELEDLKKKGRENEVSRAKGLMVYWSYRELGVKIGEIAKYLEVTGPAVTKLIKKGEQSAKEEEMAFKVIK